MSYINIPCAQMDLIITTNRSFFGCRKHSIPNWYFSNWYHFQFVQIQVSLNQPMGKSVGTFPSEAPNCMTSTTVSIIGIEIFINQGKPLARRLLFQAPITSHTVLHTINQPLVFLRWLPSTLHCTRQTRKTCIGVCVCACVCVCVCVCVRVCA